ncbi:hypothetical protein BDN72DRAFT_748648, partial [Pluteus cervinus]
IVAALPVILELALVLFEIGLNLLLWSLNRTVALGVVVITTFSLFFIFGTTLAPTLQ